jgi:hypothetical protein
MAHLTKEGEPPWHRLLLMMATNPTNEKIQKLINSRGSRKTCISVMEEGMEIENVTEKMRGRRRRPGSHAVFRLRLNRQLNHTHTSMAHFTKEGEPPWHRLLLMMATNPTNEWLREPARASCPKPSMDTNVVQTVLHLKSGGGGEVRGPTPYFDFDLIDSSFRGGGGVVGGGGGEVRGPTSYFDFDLIQLIPYAMSFSQIVSVKTTVPVSARGYQGVPGVPGRKRGRRRSPGSHVVLRLRLNRQLITTTGVRWSA